MDGVVALTRRHISVCTHYFIKFSWPQSQVELMASRWLASGSLKLIMVSSSCGLELGSFRQHWGQSAHPETFAGSHLGSGSLLESSFELDGFHELEVHFMHPKHLMEATGAQYAIPNFNSRCKQITGFISAKNFCTTFISLNYKWNHLFSGTTAKHCMSNYPL
jgi:hypothetical protein